MLPIGDICNLSVSVGKNQAKSQISGKNVKIQICSNPGY